MDIEEKRMEALETIEEAHEFVESNDIIHVHILAIDSDGNKKFFTSRKKIKTKHLGTLEDLHSENLGA